MVPPITRADVKAPTKMAYCCGRGVAPTRKPVLRSCDVVPPLDDAMHTTAATVRAASESALDVWPSDTNTRQVMSRAATVMPEIGFDDDPISPVNRDETVTNRKPRSTIRAAAMR